MHILVFVFLFPWRCGQLLEEMLDNGYPLATESNVLKELIKPPSLIRSMVHTITGESKLAK